MLIENKNTHKNHRMRLYDTISQVGLDKTNDFLALEFILTYVIPRKDTNPVAHRLIDKYGSIPNVLEANINDLSKIEGLGLQSARMLTMIPKILERYSADKSKGPKPFTKKEHLIDYAYGFMQNKDIEELYGIFIDNAMKVVGTAKLSSGNSTKVSINKKLFLQRSLSFSTATQLVVVHCHPNFNIKPSNEDLKAIEDIQLLLDAINLRLYDSLIYGGKLCFSMKDNRIYKVGEK